MKTLTPESPERKGKDLLAKIGQTLRSSAETLVQETRELTRVGKIKMELLSLENERGRKFEEIGRLTHTLYKGGTELPDDLKQLLAAVDEIEAKIDAKNQEAERLGKEGAVQADVEPTAAARPLGADETPPLDIPVEEPGASKFCPQCGSRLGMADKFCSKCGTALSS